MILFMYWQNARKRASKALLVTTLLTVNDLGVFCAMVDSNNDDDDG